MREILKMLSFKPFLFADLIKLLLVNKLYEEVLGLGFYLGLRERERERERTKVWVYLGRVAKN